MICDQIILHCYLIRSIMWIYSYLYYGRMMLNNEHSNRIIFEMGLLVHSVHFIIFSYSRFVSASKDCIFIKKWCKFQNNIFSQFSDRYIQYFKVMHWVQLSVFPLCCSNFHCLFSIFAISVHLWHDIKVILPIQSL